MKQVLFSLEVYLFFQKQHAHIKVKVLISGLAYFHRGI